MTKIEPCEVCECTDERHTEADCGEYLAKRHEELLDLPIEKRPQWWAFDLGMVEWKLKRLSE